MPVDMLAPLLSLCTCVCTRCVDVQLSPVQSSSVLFSNLVSAAVFVVDEYDTRTLFVGPFFFLFPLVSLFSEGMRCLFLGVAFTFGMLDGLELAVWTGR